MVKKNGFAGYPVVDAENNLIGIITGRDTRFVKDLSKTVSQLMTKKEDLVTVKEGASRETILELMHKNRVEKVLVVDDAFKLKGMITVKDFQKAEQKPNACKDEFGRLRVGAAVGAGPGNEERIDALVKAGVDVLLIDSSHGHSEGVLQRVRETRAKYPNLPIVAGNVATAEGAIALADAGASAVKVGIGAGSVCAVSDCAAPCGARASRAGHGPAVPGASGQARAGGPLSATLPDDHGSKERTLSDAEKFRGNRAGHGQCVSPLGGAPRKGTAGRDAAPRARHRPRCP